MTDLKVTTVSAVVKENNLEYHLVLHTNGEKQQNYQTWEVETLASTLLQLWTTIQIA